MRIEHLQGFDIRGYHRDYRAFLLALELCRAQSAQRSENPAAQHGKEAESNVVIPVLLQVAQQSAQYSAAYRERDYPAVGKRDSFPHDLRNSHRAEKRNAHGAEKSQGAVYYREHHYVCQASEQHDKARHYPGATPAYRLLHSATSV